jgi:hypothetical protein
MDGVEPAPGQKFGPNDTKSSSGLTRWSLVFAFLSSVIGLTFAGFAGSRSRFVADDYWFELAVRERGFWHVQIEFYRGWSGRLSAAFLQTSLKALGPWTAGVFPAVILVVWITGSWYAAHQLGRPYGVSRLAKLSLGTSYVAACVFAMPNMFQSLFWQSGSPSYAVPQALFPWAIGIVADRKLPVLRHLVAAFILFFVVTSSEPSAITYFGSLCALAFFFRSQWQRFVGPFVGALLGFVALVGAPGNSVRRSALLVHRSALTNMVLSIVQWGSLLFDLAVKHPWSLVGAAAIGVACSALVRDSLVVTEPGNPFLRRVTTLTIVLGCFIPLASFLTSAFLTGAIVPVRVHPILLSPILLAVGIAAFGFTTARQHEQTSRGSSKAKAQASKTNAQANMHVPLSVRGSVPAVCLALVAIIGPSFRLPAELAGGARLTALNRSIDEQLKAKGTTKIEVPKFVGGVFFVSPLDFENPNSYWSKRFNAANVKMVTVPTGIWGPTSCQNC